MYLKKSRHNREVGMLTQLSDAWLHSGATIVEMPHPGRRQRQVRVPDPIGVTLQGKQSWLRIGLLDPLPRHNATPCVTPTVDMVLKLRDLPAGIHRLIA